MFDAALIMFRETLEMALVLGVLFAAVRGIARARLAIWAGAAGGVVLAVLLGIFMEQMESALAGDGEFVFNACVLVLASILLGWTVIWMQRHGREIAARLRQTGEAVARAEAPLWALAGASFAAVAREGSEAAFFLFSAAQASGAEAWSLELGGLLGAGAAALLGWLLYRGVVRLPVGRALTVAGWLLVFIAAGMASQAAWNLVLIGWLPALGAPVWDLSDWLARDSSLGTLLRVLIGYDDAPSPMQVIVFVLALGMLSWAYARARSGAERAHDPR